MRNSKGPKNSTAKEIFLIKSLKILVDGIAATFGSRCEVVLHDLRNLGNLNHSIVKIANEHVTGRNVGGPITDQGLRHYRSASKDNLLINYPSVTKDGKQLKSSTITFRNEKEKPIAAICINFDLTDIMNFNKALEDIFKIAPEKLQDTQAVETFQSDIVSTLNDIADEATKKAGKTIPLMERKDKIGIVRELEDQGFFLIKGAVKLIASKLRVSKYTIYNYLEKIREEKNNSLKPD